MNKVLNKYPLRLTVANASDAATLSRIGIQGFSETFGHLYTPENLANHLEKTCSPEFFVQALKEDVIFIAYWDNTPVGYAKAGKVGLPVEAPLAAMELHRLYVLEPYQGKRIGDTLMQAVLDLPMMRSAHRVYVGAWEHNHRALRFYGKYGFKPVGEYMYRVGPHADREIIMLRTQEPS